MNDDGAMGLTKDQRIAQLEADLARLRQLEGSTSQPPPITSVEAAPSPRPVLIDQADGPCEICAEWAKRKYVQVAANGKIRYDYRCDGCDGIIPNVGPPANGRGIQACVPHHFHLRGVGPSGVPGREGVFQELCLDCAIKMRLKVYPPEKVDHYGNHNPTEEYMRNYKG
jgi:hypothetical protein